MKFLRKFWECLCDVEDDHDYSGWTRFIVWLQGSAKILIWLGTIIGACWLLFNLPRTVIVILFFIILVIVANFYYNEKRRSQNLKRKYDEILTGIRKRKSKEYLKNNIKIVASKIQPAELANERTYYLYVTIINMGKETVFHLDLQLKLYDKYGHWLEKQELTISELIAPREDKEFKIALLQEKYPYPMMSQFKELKVRSLACSIFKPDNTI